MSQAPPMEKFRRYREIARLMWKHGRADWVRKEWLDDATRDGGTPDQDGPESLARDLEKLGPTFVKIGQLLASRADLIPPSYLKALSRLHDHVEPVPFEDIRKTIATELKARPSRIFEWIDPKPLAAASLAQVHAARLRDGREVVVKVQRPGVHEQIKGDFEAFETIARLSKHSETGRRYNLEELVTELRRTVELELDYRQEIDNLLTLRRNLESFSLLYIPEPIPDFCSGRVLTMERISGTSVTTLSPVVFTEIQGSALAEELFSAYLKQILVDGFFHADPHPGNVLVMQDSRLALVDLGMIGRIDISLRQELLQLIIAVSEGRGRDAAEVAIRIGTPSAHFKREDFIDRVSGMVLKNEKAQVKDIEAGRLVLEIQQIAAETGIRLPSTLTLVGKALLNLDAIARTLAPGFNPNEAIRRQTAQLVGSQLWERLDPRKLFHSVLEFSEMVGQFPRRLNELLVQVGKSGFPLDVDAFDEKTFIRGFQKVANRITSGLVLAALIIGAALVMRVETSFRIMGYPGLAILLFLGAALGGVVLLVQILWHDRDDSKSS